MPVDISMGEYELKIKKYVQYNPIFKRVITFENQFLLFVHIKVSVQFIERLMRLNYPKENTKTGDLRMYI